MTDCRRDQAGQQRNHSLCKSALQEVSVSWVSIHLLKRHVIALNYIYVLVCVYTGFVKPTRQLVCLHMISRICLLSASEKWNVLVCVFSEWYDLNQRATASTRTKLLCCTNPLLRKINICKGQTEQEWKMQISSSVALTHSPTPTCYESAMELVKVVGGVIAQGLLNWRPSEVTLEKKHKTDLTQQADKYFMCKCIQNMRMMVAGNFSLFFCHYLTGSTDIILWLPTVLPFLVREPADLPTTEFMLTNECI